MILPCQVAHVSPLCPLALRSGHYAEAAGGRVLPTMHTFVTGPVVLALLAWHAPNAIPAHYESDISHERQQEAQALNTPTGWLSLVALQPLTIGKVSVGSAPDNTLRLEHGLAHAFTLEVEPGKVLFATVDPSVTIDGKHPHAGDPVRISDSTDAMLHWGALWANVIRRTGDQTYLRIGDPNSPNRRSFHGLHFYPVNPAYRITAKWVPYTPAHELRMGTVLGTTLVVPSPGFAEFTLDGQTIRLDAMGGENGVTFSFRDGTFKTTTYGAGREVTADPPSNGLDHPGSILIDFNKAGNWPCAYTQYGTCPLPPTQNRFDALIPAGEKRYHD